MSLMTQFFAGVADYENLWRLCPLRLWKFMSHLLWADRDFMRGVIRCAAAGNISIIQRLILYLLGNKCRSSVIVCFLNTCCIWPFDQRICWALQIRKTARERQILLNKGLTLPLAFKSEIFDISAPPHHPNQQSLCWIEGVLHGSQGILFSQTLCFLVSSIIWFVNFQS